MMPDVMNPKFPVFMEIAPKKTITHRGHIVSGSVVRVTCTQFMIIDIVVHNKSFRRFAILSVKIARALYDYIYTDGRSSRMKDTLFEFEIEPVSQKITAYKAYDPDEFKPFG